MLGVQRSQYFKTTPGGTRTPNRRFWRPLLYQLSYWRLFNLAPARNPNRDRLPFEQEHDYDETLVQNLADATRPDGFSAFTNGEANGLLHRDRGDQLDFN